MKILLLSRYGRMGASSRLRSMQYIPYLTAHGVEVTENPLLGEAYLENLYAGHSSRPGPILSAYLRRVGLLLNSRDYDLIWIEKELFPWLPAWMEQLLGILKVPYVVDYDDAIFHNYDLNRRKWIRTWLGNKISHVMSNASLVTVGNCYLAEHAKHAGAMQVEIIPTVVDLERYATCYPTPRPVFTIGWIGTPKTVGYLSMVETALREVCSGNSARLRLVGAGSAKIRGITADVREWSEDTEVSDIQSFDLGIMPLPDDPWERGKCGYKLIQYMACGKPVVASPVGVNCDIVERGKTGYLATDHDGWVSSLKSLMADANKCAEMGRLARAKVESLYSLQVTAPHLLELFQRVISKSKQKGR